MPMDERYVDYDSHPSYAGDKRRQGLQDDTADLAPDSNVTEKEAFGYSEPGGRPGAAEEDSVPLSGSLSRTDTFVTGEQFRNDPFADLEESGESMDFTDEDPFDPYRRDEFARENGLTPELEDASTEFGGELVPLQAGPVLLPAQRAVQTDAADNGRNRTERWSEGVTEEMSEALPDAHTASGWISIVLAVASLFYWPAVLGPAAVVGGVIAYLLGNRSLGGWSVILGLIAVAAHLFLIPYAS